jgi:preprotein translocase subunit SecA
MDAGGLFIVGTERHESRASTTSCAAAPAARATRRVALLPLRRGRPRAPVRRRPIYKILDRLGTTDEEGNEEPIEAGMLTKQIEKAQRKVEEQNFLIRKRVLEYDDVMNEQRPHRLRVPRPGARGPRHGRAVAPGDRGVVERLVDEYAAADYVEDWDLEGPVRRARRTSTR